MFIPLLMCILYFFQNYREMIPLLGIFRIVVILLIGMYKQIRYGPTANGLKSVRFAFGHLLFFFSLSVGTDVGFALYRRFLSDEAGMKVKKKHMGYKVVIKPL